MDAAKIIEMIYNEQKKSEGPYEARTELVSLIHNIMVDMEVDGTHFTAQEFQARLQQKYHALKKTTKAA